MSPRHPGWEAFAESVAPGARITRMHRLVGGGSADTYDATLDRAPGRVVVKVFRDGDDTAPLEWSRLKFAQRVTMPVPEPIAADLESTWFDRPAIVMSRLTGRPDVDPKDVDAWIGALARALTELHDTALDGAEGALTRPVCRTGSERSHGSLAVIDVRARRHSRGLQAQQRALASRPYQRCRRLE